MSAIRPVAGVGTGRTSETEAMADIGRDDDSVLSWRPPGDPRRPVGLLDNLACADNRRGR